VDESSTLEPQREEPTNRNNTTASNTFASALLGALDDDIAKDPGANAAPGPPRPPTSGPSSGLLTSLVGGGDGLQQIRINTDFILLP
jgi:hypothetical protein